MKILMTLYQIQDYGGIINHLENLTHGFRRNGHQVDVVMLCPKHKITNVKSKRDDWQVNPHGTGYKFNQARGWTGLPKVPYLNAAAREAFRDRCEEYDGVLWHIPVPTLNKENKGVSEWVELYSSRAKNFAILHDGNFPKLYPHLNHVKDYFKGLICVHEAAYNAAAAIDLKRILIVNPFDLHTWRRNPEGFAPLGFNARNGFTSVQIFKAWKRVDELIRAIPLMNSTQHKRIGGAGIEYRYMTSKDKCKPKYYNEHGEKIWDAALKRGMLYLGTIPNSSVYAHLMQSKLQIDPSWSHKYAAYGAHFNRTTVEAMICGAVPMATDLGMIDSKIFKPDINYVQIPHDTTPNYYAALLDHCLSEDYKVQWETIRQNNLELIPRFDLQTVAGAYGYVIQWSNFADRTTNQYSAEKGLLTDEVREASKKNLKFFGITTTDNYKESLDLFRTH
jgi:hypothetical protein